jgi:hypothetical protein
LKTFAKALAFALVIAGTAPLAEAAPYTISISSFSGGTAVLNAPGTLANGLNVELGSVVVSGALGTFEAYCVDLQHYVSPGSYQATLDSMANWNNTAAPPHASLGSGAASWLYDTYAASAVGNNDMRAALSLAIWDALYNNVYNVTTVNSGFWVTNVSSAAFVTQANSMLAALKNYQGTFTQEYWLRTVDKTNNYTQDFMGRIPEPAAVASLFVGSVAVFLMRRRMMLRVRPNTE